MSLAESKAMFACAMVVMDKRRFIFVACCFLTGAFFLLPLLLHVTTMVKMSCQNFSEQTMTRNDGKYLVMRTEPIPSSCAVLVLYWWSLVRVSGMVPVCQTTLYTAIITSAIDKRIYKLLLKRIQQYSTAAALPPASIVYSLSSFSSFYC